jgi:hypothetical protein
VVSAVSAEICSHAYFDVLILSVSKVVEKVIKQLLEFFFWFSTDFLEIHVGFKKKMFLSDSQS